MRKPWLVTFVRAAPLGVAVALLVMLAAGQDWPLGPALPKDRFRSGETVLSAFAPISAATRNSIVKFNVDGQTVALGAVVDTNGLVLTKASELKPGKLTCWLATEEEVGAEVLAADEDEDVALVRVHARGLKPICWASGEVALGQWAITPGIAETPHAVGIISALPRKIRPERAFVGIQFDSSGDLPRIADLIPGLGAERAGLKPGDIILAVNQDGVTNREQLIESIRNFRAGQTVSLSVKRGDKEFRADVELAPLKLNQLGRGQLPEDSGKRLAGDVSRRSQGFELAIEHDTVLQPWLCGGPLVNLRGEAIGLNIARASRVTTYALSARLVQGMLQDLIKAQTPVKTSLTQ